MPWGRMDDKFHRNEKVRNLRRLRGGMEALGVWVFWWSWCLDDPTLTGFVSEGELSRNDIKASIVLVESGLWDRVAGGFQFHDFNDYNPTREQVETRKASDRDRHARKKPGNSTSHSAQIPSGIPSGIRGELASTRAPGDGTGLGSGSPDPDRVGDAQDWRDAFAAAWCRKKGKIAYGAGESDARATARMGDFLTPMSEAERASAWGDREAIFAGYFAIDKGKNAAIADAGHCFAFFTPRFLGLAEHAARNRPSPPPVKRNGHKTMRPRPAPPDEADSWPRPGETDAQREMRVEAMTANWRRETEAWEAENANRSDVA